MDQPIACSLPAADFQLRKQDAAQIAREALRSREPLAGGTRLTFAASGDTERNLRELIAAEADCCSFLRFELDRDGETLLLDVTGPDDAQPIIAELFA
jgi:hypothetical protein